MILALDLGTNMGYAVGNSLGKVASGSVDFSTKRNEGGGMRYLRFTRWLIKIIAEYDVTEIYYEEVKRHSSVAAAHVYGSFEGHLMVACDDPDCPIPYQSVPVGTIKKYASGKGNCGKPEMIKAAIKKGWLLFGSEDHDQADALWILDYARNILGAE